MHSFAQQQTGGPALRRTNTYGNARQSIKRKKSFKAQKNQLLRGNSTRNLIGSKKKTKNNTDFDDMDNIRPLRPSALELLGKRKERFKRRNAFRRQKKDAAKGPKKRTSKFGSFTGGAGSTDHEEESRKSRLERSVSRSVTAGHRTNTGSWEIPSSKATDAEEGECKSRLFEITAFDVCIYSIVHIACVVLGVLSCGGSHAWRDLGSHMTCVCGGGSFCFGREYVDPVFVSSYIVSYHIELGVCAITCCLGLVYIFLLNPTLPIPANT